MRALLYVALKLGFLVLGWHTCIWSSAIVFGGLPWLASFYITLFNIVHLSTGSSLQFVIPLWLGFCDVMPSLVRACGICSYWSYLILRKVVLGFFFCKRFREGKSLVSLVVDLLCICFYWLYYVCMFDTFSVWLFDVISGYSAALKHWKIIICSRST